MDCCILGNKLHAVRMACNVCIGHWILDECSPWRIALSSFLPLFCHKDLKVFMHISSRPYFLHSTTLFPPAPPQWNTLSCSHGADQVNIRMAKARTILALIASLAPEQTLIPTLISASISSKMQPTCQKQTILHLCHNSFDRLWPYYSHLCPGLKLPASSTLMSQSV